MTEARTDILLLVQAILRRYDLEAIPAYIRRKVATPIPAPYC